MPNEFKVGLFWLVAILLWDAGAVLVGVLSGYRASKMFNDIEGADNLPDNGDGLLQNLIEVNVEHNNDKLYTWTYLIRFVLLVIAVVGTVLVQRGII